MKRVILFILNILVISSLFAQNKFQDVKIVESNSSYLIFELTPIFDSMKTISSESEEFSFLKFRYALNGNNETGSPDLSFRSIGLGLPSLEGNIVEVISDGYETINNINYIPAAAYVKSEDSLSAVKLYQKDEKAYRKNLFYPENIVSLADIGIARDRIIGSVKVYPLQYNPVTKQLRKYSKIRIKVTYGLNKSVKVNNVSSIGGKDNLQKNSMLNYDQASSWSYVPAYKTVSSVTNSVLNSGTWYKIEVKENGIFKLDATFFKNAGISLTNVDPRTVRIFGNGGGEVAEDPTASRPNDLVECAVYASGETDGAFGDTDYFLFYGEGPDKWVYDGTAKRYRHFINHYSTSNYYFLTYGGTEKGKRVSSFSSETSASPAKASNLNAKYVVEPEKVNISNSGKQWYGQALTSSYSSTSYLSSKLDGILSSEPVTYRTVVGAKSNDQTYLKIEQNGQAIGNAYVYYTIAGDSYKQLAISDTITFKATTTIADSKFNFKVTYYPNESSDAGYLDWIEAFYKRSLTTSADEIQYYTPDTNAYVEYNLAGFSNSNILVFDVSEHNNVKLLSNGSISAGTIKYQLKSEEGKVSQLIAVGSNGYKSPSSTSKVTNSNLHGESAGAEYIIITPNDADFLALAETYKTFRESSKKNPLKTKIANLEYIYNEFSSGKVDPGAIRDYLKYCFENWTIKPAYVFFFGDGSYDYKNINNNSNFTQLNRVPVWETTLSDHEVDSYTSDDFYARIVGNDSAPDIAIGRATVITKADAKLVINKFMSYESSAPNSWKNRLTFVADDGLRTGDKSDDGDDYTTQSETLAQDVSPKQFDKTKIYIVNYKTVVATSGRTKPDANIAIIKTINDGTLITNYIGHGSPYVWAHEGVMKNAVTIPALNNGDKLTFVIAATCDFGRYDDWQNQSGTELFLLRDGGGAIGVVSASRSVYSGDNYEFNRDFITNLFTRKSDSKFYRLGDVMLNVKQFRFNDNDSKFHLFSDPGLRLNAPDDLSEIDSINNIYAQNSSDTITLKALGKANIKGYVKTSGGLVNSSYNGKVQITIYDAPKLYDFTEGIGRFRFEQPGGIIYSGMSSISNGRFTSDFYVPKDISYEKRCGKISMYFYDEDSDGYGAYTNIMMTGTDTAGVNDANGPVVNVYLNDRNFKSGDLVSEKPLLLIDLYDESGINTTGLGVGHRFEAYLDNSADGISLNAYYKGKTDSYKEGSAEYQLDKLSNGNHKMKVKVYDVFNNPASSEVSFKVQNQESLSLTNVMNYPNPFSKSTKFTMQQNQDGPIDVTIKVYTVAGRLIKIINEYGITSRFVQIPWDGRDEDGDELANGVYLYKVITKTQDGKFTEEAIGKLSVLK